MKHSFEEKMQYSSYLKMLIPSILTMVFLSFYTTIDGYFVSKYVGATALAGINIVIPITCITFGIAVMFATGSQAIIGEKLGKKQHQQANETFSCVSVTLCLICIIFTMLSLFFLPEILQILGCNETLYPHVYPYALWIILSSVPMTFKLYFEYMVRTDGRSKIGLWMSGIGLILNILLDYIFVKIFHMGTLGAALGTSIAITVSAIIGCIYFLKYSQLRFVSFSFQKQIIMKTCSNGCSEMLTEFSTGITTLLFNLSILHYLGENGIAAISILMYVYYFFISFYMGISVATAPIISYTKGSNHIQKMKETLNYSFFTILISSIFIFLISFFGAKQIVAIFTDHPQVVTITIHALKIFSILFLFIGWNVFFSSYFTAIHNGLLSAIISSLRSFLLVIVWLFLLPRFFQESGIWMTMPLSELCTFFISILIFYKYNQYYTKPTT